MKILAVGVEVLEIDEQAFVMGEVRPGVPGRGVQLDEAIAGYSEGGDVLVSRPRIVPKVAGWRDADQSFLAAE